MKDHSDMESYIPQDAGPSMRVKLLVDIKCYLISVYGDEQLGMSSRLRLLSFGQFLTSIDDCCYLTRGLLLLIARLLFLVKLLSALRVLSLTRQLLTLRVFSVDTESTVDTRDAVMLRLLLTDESNLDICLLRLGQQLREGYYVSQVEYSL